MREALIEKVIHQTQEKQLENEVSELRLRLQSSEERAEAMATQCKAMELELRKTQVQRDQLNAHNQELQKELKESEQGTASLPFIHCPILSLQWGFLIPCTGKGQCPDRADGKPTSRRLIHYSANESFFSRMIAWLAVPSGRAMAILCTAGAFQVVSVLRSCSWMLQFDSPKLQALPEPPDY